MIDTQDTTRQWLVMKDHARLTTYVMSRHASSFVVSWPSKPCRVESGGKVQFGATEFVGHLSLRSTLLCRPLAVDQLVHQFAGKELVNDHSLRS